MSGRPVGSGRMWQVLPAGLKLIEAGDAPRMPSRRGQREGRTLRLWRIRSGDDLRRIRAWIRRQCARAGCPPELGWRIQVSVNEVTTNALLHGGGGTCHVGWDREGIHVRVASRFGAQDVGEVRRVLEGPRRQGSWKGNGLRIAASYADRVVIAADEGRFQVWLDFRLREGGGHGHGDRSPTGG